MAVERTLCIVKPDATSKAGAAGEILRRVEQAGLKIVGVKMLRFMTSGPILPAVLEGESAIARWRELMGPTDVAKAPKGTIRGDLGTDVERNAVHGSDAAETARVEIAYFFNAAEIAGPVEALP
jgi:nucleoside-diphosphate kinase